MPCRIAHLPISEDRPCLFPELAAANRCLDPHRTDCHSVGADYGPGRQPGCLTGDKLLPRSSTEDFLVVQNFCIRLCGDAEMLACIIGRKVLLIIPARSGSMSMMRQ